MPGLPDVKLREGATNLGCEQLAIKQGQNLKGSSQMWEKHLLMVNCPEVRPVLARSKKHFCLEPKSLKSRKYQ